MTSGKRSLAQSGLLPTLGYKLLLEYCHVHSFMYYLQQLVALQRQSYKRDHVALKTSKYLLSDPTKKIC